MENRPVLTHLLWFPFPFPLVFRYGFVSVLLSCRSVHLLSRIARTAASANWHVPPRPRVPVSVPVPFVIARPSIVVPLGFRVGLTGRRRGYFPPQGLYRGIEKRS